MKILLLFLLNTLPVVLFCQHHSADRPGVHGMMLMGNEIVYASHLPMFHSPHDYQIILRLKLAQEDQRLYQADKKIHPDETVYTLEPERFILPAMIVNPKKFKASIYRGHFERGGIKIIEDMEVEIVERLYYKQFEGKEQRPKNKQYLLFGNAKEMFMAHLISVAPDFDEIVQVEAALDNSTLLVSGKTLLVEFPERENRKPFSWKTTEALNTIAKEKLTINKIATLYVEYGDLD